MVVERSNPTREIPSATAPREPRPDEFQRFHPFRSRGLASLEQNVGGVRDAIEALLGRVDRPRILEIGCGYCTALVELRLHYGERVELHGINKRSHHGTWTTARESVAKLGLLPIETFDALAPPTLHYCDVDLQLPFPDASFDFVFSQMSFVYYHQKARVLEEIDRILAPGGIARIDMQSDREGVPGEYAHNFEIWEAGTLIPFWDYVERFDALAPRAAGRGFCLELAKGPAPLRLDLEFVASINLSAIHSEWWGTKSVYRVAR